MKKMYVGNIPYNATEEDLRELFSEYGEIESLKIIQDQFTGQSKGFGFIEMVNEEDAKKAMAGLNEKDFMGSGLLKQDPNRNDKVLVREVVAMVGVRVQGEAGDNFWISK